MNNEFVCLKDKFRLLQEIKKLIIYSDTYVYSNFPKEKKHLKIVSSRRYSSILRILGNIKKLLYGWMNEESK